MIRPEDRKVFVDELKEESYFRLIATPVDYQPTRIPKKLLKETLLNSRIHLVGDSFPLIHWSEDAQRHGSDYIESIYAGHSLRSACRLFISGQFVHLDRVLEDDPDVKAKLRDRLNIEDSRKDQLTGYVDFLWTMNRFCEYVAFVAKLAKVLETEGAWNIEVSLQNPGVRALSVLDISRMISNLYCATTPVVVSRAVSIEQLRAETAAVAVEIGIDFFAGFEFDATAEILMSIAEKYLPQ